MGLVFYNINTVVYTFSTLHCKGTGVDTPLAASTVLLLACLFV